MKGFQGKVKWNSTHKKMASVSSRGIVKGKKIGNTIIYATHGGKIVGCAVSVLTPGEKKVICKVKK